MATANAGSKGRGKVISCSCSHSYQDKKYGKNKRYANETTKGYRCTVCSKNVL